MGATLSRSQRTCSADMSAFASAAAMPPSRRTPPWRECDGPRCLSFPATQRLRRQRLLPASASLGTRCLFASMGMPTSEVPPAPAAPLDLDPPSDQPGFSFGFADPAFAERVSGEWFGYEERFVPEAYREWGVVVTGFDSLWSTTVTESHELRERRTRALPTVGCEADAVAGEVSDTTAGATEGGERNGGFADGSYSLGPASLTATDVKLPVWRFCLAHPRNDARHRSRARLHFGRIDSPKASVAAATVNVWVEEWDAPFCAGAVLPGCGGKEHSFAEEERAAPDAAAGVWRIDATVCHAARGWAARSYSRTITRSQVPALLLPRGLAVRVAPASAPVDDQHDAEDQYHSEDSGVTSGATVVEASWQPDPAIRSVVRRFYDARGRLSFVEQAIETAQE